MKIALMRAAARIKGLRVMMTLGHNMTQGQGEGEQERGGRGAGEGRAGQGENDVT